MPIEEIVIDRGLGDGTWPARLRLGQSLSLPSIGSADDSGDEYERLGIEPTPAPTERFGAAMPWDEETRPRRPRSGPEVAYSERGRQVGQHLIDVHDGLRGELEQLRSLLDQVRAGKRTAGEARDELSRMTLRQNDWTLGAFCSRYCVFLTRHHTLEDDSIFPHLRSSDPALGPVIDKLTEEHVAIGDAVDAVDRALVAHINDPADFASLQATIDALTDILLSHLSYEEVELVEPLARHGFMPGQV